MIETLETIAFEIPRDADNALTEKWAGQELLVPDFYDMWCKRACSFMMV